MWHSIDPEPRTWYRWRLNGAEAYLYRNGEEWRTACLPVALAALSSVADGPQTSGLPSGAVVSVTASRGSRVALKPIMPGRPYLISARNPVRILGDTEIRFDVDLPVPFSFETENGLTLCALEPYILSNTWFGDTTGGILCFSLRTALLPQCRDEMPDPAECPVRRKSLVRCPILVKNGAKAPFDLKQVAVYTDLLGIYDTPDGLATDTVVVEGLSDGTLKMNVRPLAGDFPRLAAAHRDQSELLIRRGVNFLRSIAGV